VPRLLIAVLLLYAQASFSVRTELVIVPVTVTDGAGRHVPGLTQDDFRVYESRRLRPITVFYHGDIPITLGVIVDRSQSMRAKESALAVALTALLDASGDEDELFAIGFHDEVVNIGPGSRAFTNDAPALATAVMRVRPGGRTALYDGVAEGLRQLERGTVHRRALVVISDGGDNISARTYADIRDQARRSQAAIYGIGLLGVPPQTEDENRSLLERLCAETGGVAYFPRSNTEVAEVAHRIASDLHQQYTLGFTPDPAAGGGTRRIDVVVVSGAGGLL
jgi:Ca-activated chloride channel family protein